MTERKNLDGFPALPIVVDLTERFDEHVYAWFLKLWVTLGWVAAAVTMVSAWYHPRYATLALIALIGVSMMTWGVLLWLRQMKRQLDETRPHNLLRSPDDPEMPSLLKSFYDSDSDVVASLDLFTRRKRHKELPRD